MTQGAKDPFRLILLSLVVFPLHVAEETAGGFVAWFNSLVHPPINLGLFLTVNLVCFAITALFAVATAKSRAPAMLSVAIGWLFFLMFANGIFHVVGTLRFGRYSPGTVTALLLYIPYSAGLTVLAARRAQLRLLPLLITLALAGIPGCIHFYRILFEGGRLL